MIQGKILLLKTCKHAIKIRFYPEIAYSGCEGQTQAIKIKSEFMTIISLHNYIFFYFGVAEDFLSCGRVYKKCKMIFALFGHSLQVLHLLWRRTLVYLMSS